MVTKQQFLTFLYIFMVASVIAMVIIVVSLLQGNAKECLQNAFIYGANKQIKGDVYCQCTEYRDDIIYIFQFNKTDWWSVPTNAIP